MFQRPFIYVTEVCTDLLIEELWALKSKTCNTMWNKLNGCIDCKFCLNIKNAETKQWCPTCLIDIMQGTITEKDKQKIKGVY